MTGREAVRWCCRHRWTLRYIAVVTTAALIVQILQVRGVL